MIEQRVKTNHLTVHLNGNKAYQVDSYLLQLADFHESLLVIDRRLKATGNHQKWNVSDDHQKGLV